MELLKYPRTQHIEGSRLQPGDEDLDSVPLAQIAGRHVVIEEKVDGASAALSFGPDGELFLQSRGHFLSGGARERHFNLFKQWAAVQAPLFQPVLHDRYILYGEWLYAKHTIFYDALPHYFLEFDCFDRQHRCFLDTPNRRQLLSGLPLVSVPVLFEGTIQSTRQLQALIGPSQFIRPGHLERLAEVSDSLGLRRELTLQQTDRSVTMEGLYIKVEEAGTVQGRYKFVRASFLTAIDQSGSHWLDRPIIPNQLAPDVDLYSS